MVQIGSPEEVYNRPNSPFVASFMGATNAIRLPARRNADGIEIAEGKHTGAASIAASALDAATVERVDGVGEILAYFRGEDARLEPAGGGARDGLVLRGEIAQASYPGGHFRYAVTVGSDQFMVDDDRRYSVGAPVAVVLPLSRLHLYPAAGKPTKLN